MELKRYVLFTDKMIYQYNKRSGLYHNMNEDKACVYGLNIRQELVEKTSDNILDLVEVGDLVKLHREHTLYVVKESKKVNIIVEDMYSENQTVRKIYIQVLWKLQYNGDYKRYEVER